MPAYDIPASSYFGVEQQIYKSYVSLLHKNMSVTNIRNKHKRSF